MLEYDGLYLLARASKLTRISGMMNQGWVAIIL